MTVPLPFREPARPPRRLRPLEALHHFNKLVENGEDTKQVFFMHECLSNPAFMRMGRRFCDSAQGHALLASEHYLPDVLDDHEALLALPAGSVAHAYVAFMRAENLSASGLVAENEKIGIPHYADGLQWYEDRLRDTHDIVHVLTGYGRDGLGEQCVLAFTYAQAHAWTDGFIAWAGGLEMKRMTSWGIPVFAAVRQAQRCGARAGCIHGEDIRALLAEPLQAARARLGVTPPTKYQAALAAMRAHGLDPYRLQPGAPAMA